eukprot:m.86737 g.86737  ORF g.86737 m.86737 type:complete len:306 (-) comp25995_c0_seq3:39-956(-)
MVVDQGLDVAFIYNRSSTDNIHLGGGNEALRALYFSMIAGLSTGVGGFSIYCFTDIGPRLNAGMLGAAAGAMLTLSFVDMFLPYLFNDNYTLPEIMMHVAAGVAIVFCLDLCIAQLNVESAIFGAMSNGDNSVPGKSPNNRTNPVPFDPTRKGKVKSALLTALALTAHNAPEGLAVGVSSLSGHTGKTYAIVIAMAMHNIPEGVAVAFAMYYATQSRHLSFVVATATGLVEPFAAVLSVMVLQNFVQPSFIDRSFMVVAGIMTTVSCKELLPQAATKSKAATTIGVVTGSVIIYTTIVALETSQE